MTAAAPPGLAVFDHRPRRVGDHTIAIQYVEDQGELLKVVVQMMRQAPESRVRKGPTRPYHMIKLTKVGRPIRVARHFRGP